MLAVAGKSCFIYTLWLINYADKPQVQGFILVVTATVNSSTQPQ